MTPAEIAALGAAGVVLIGAVAGAIVTVITAWSTVAGKVSAIEGHVNSEKTAADGRERTLQSENDLLREIIADQKAAAGLLAQAVVSRSRTVEAAATITPLPALPTIKIDADLHTLPK